VSIPEKKAKSGPKKWLGQTKVQAVNIEMDMYENLVKWSEEERRSISELIRQCIQTELDRNKIKGYVYFMKEDVTGKVKIGRTKDIERRNGELNAKAPWNIETIFKIKTNNAPLTERLFHEKFKEKRLPGSEWFTLSPEDIEYVMNGMYDNAIMKSIKD
jgi:predicted CopG family antitoxin